MRSLIIFALIISALAQTPELDQTVFPEWGDYSAKFKTYSGLLQVAPTRQIHYVFIESASNPSKDPVVLWLNGGPGCSSLIGMMQELGPYTMMSGETQFTENPWSWNKQANMLFFESPAGVGFSTNTDPNWKPDDDSTGDDNYVALLQWFNRFTTYKQRAFFVSGESYAGMYVPYTAKTIIEGNKAAIATQKINLQGILIGNGVLSFDVMDKASVKFYTNRNFVDLTTKYTLLNQCEIYPLSFVCMNAENNFYQAISEVNPYGVYSYCWQDSTKAEFKTPSYTRFPYTPWLNSKVSNGVDAPCLDFGPPNNYFNKDTVKAALHVDTSILFETCKDLGYVKEQPGSYQILPIIKNAGVRILIYSGDQDGAVSVQDTLDALKLLNLKVLQGTQNLGYIKLAWTPWVNSQQKIVGWKVIYDILSFYIVRAAGHMVPQDQREVAFNMFNGFINSN